MQSSLSQFDLLIGEETIALPIFPVSIALTQPR